MTALPQHPLALGRSTEPGLVDPASGLASDYLNQFHEVILLLDLVSQDGECLAELDGWFPRSYLGHFGASTLAERAMVIDAYMRCTPVTRRLFDRLCAETGNMVSAGLDALMRGEPTGNVAIAPAARVLASELREAVHRLEEVIHPRGLGRPTIGF